MRTTVDMPAELMQAAKVRAAEGGETLNDLVTRAVAQELRIPARPARSGRVSFPLVGRDATPSVNVTNADIEAALEAEDIDRYARRPSSSPSASGSRRHGVGVPPIAPRPIGFTREKMTSRCTRERT